MQAIIHYYSHQVLVQDIDNLTVATEHGLVIEFKQEKNVDYYAEKLEKAKIPVLSKGKKMISIDSTGFTVFDDCTYEMS